MKCTSRLVTAALTGIALLSMSYSQRVFANTPSALPALLKEVQKKYSTVGTISADFSQVVDDSVVSKKKKVSSGKIYLKRPGKIRWEVLKPEVSLLISNGKKYWFYTPPFDEDERGQLIEKNSAQVQSKLVDALISGTFSNKTFEKIQQKGTSTFVLIPKKGTAGTVMKALVEINPTEKLIQKVTLIHKGGNRSEVTLSQVQLGTPLEDQLFIFSAPPNTDIVK